MKKYLLLLLLMFTVCLFAQAAGDAGTGTSAGVGATTTTTTGNTGGTGGSTGGTTTDTTTAATLKELEDLKKELADQRKELADQKTAAELAKLNEADRAKKQLELDRQEIENEKQKLNLDRNTILGKSILLSEKINIGGDFLPYLNITATDKESDITTRATNLKSALDAYVKRFIDDKTAGFDPAKKGGAGGGDDVAAYAAKLVGKGEVKDNPYFKLG